MRRLSTTIVIALSTLLLVSMSSAQQKSQPQTSNPPGQPCNTALCFIENTHGLGGYQQKSADFNIDGTGTANIINAGTSYQIGGSSVLSIGSARDINLFLGVGAGANNVGEWGGGNTFLGPAAGHNNTTAALNTFTGAYAGYYNTSGDQNTFSGNGAGFSNTTGYLNTFYGLDAGYYNTTGFWNAFSGSFAGGFNTTGSYNTFAGAFAGFGNTTGSNNVYIANLGCQYPCNESSTIRIGGDVGSGYGPQTAAYIAGIYGSTSSGGIAVYVNSNGQLGTSTSSLRFKEQVHDMGDRTTALMKLRPVTFLYKPEYDKGERSLQYGLIAEEVAKVYPELVAYDNDGQPYTVRYQYLTTMLLNELQKEHRMVEELKSELQVQKAALKKQNEQLQQRLTGVETLLQSQVNSAIAQTASAVSLQPEGTQK